MAGVSEPVGRFPVQCGTGFVVGRTPELGHDGGSPPSYGELRDGGWYAFGSGCVESTGEVGQQLAGFQSLIVDDVEHSGDVSVQV